MYLSCNISSTESNSTICIVNIWTAIKNVIEYVKSDLSDGIKREFFQDVDASVLLYSCTTWTQRKQFEEKARWKL